MHATRIATTWTTMWNREPDLAEEICADDFSLYFGSDPEGNGRHPMDHVVGPDGLKAFIRDYQDRPQRVEFRVVRVLADGGGFLVALWDATVPGADGDRVLGGNDTFVLAEDGRISRVYSITGSRPIIE